MAEKRKTLEMGPSEGKENAKAKSLDKGLPSDRGLVRAPLKERNGLAVNVNGIGSTNSKSNSTATAPITNTNTSARKGCIAEVVVWKGKVNKLLLPHQQQKKPENNLSQLFVVSYPDVDVPLSQRLLPPPKNKTILKEKVGKNTADIKPRVLGTSGQRRIPRTVKQPKAIKFISPEEHRQMLQEYIRNATAAAAAAQAKNQKENKNNTDFRVDSLFKQEQAHQQTISQSTDVSAENAINKSAESSSNPPMSMPMSIQNVLPSDTNENVGQINPADNNCNELNPADESRHSHMDDSGLSQHSFTVDNGDLFVDDVARYELVESTEISSVDFEAFAALGTISGPVTNSNGRKPPKIPRMTNQRRAVKTVSATTTTEDASGVKTIEIFVDDSGKPRCTYTELIEKALTEAGDLTVSEIYQWISKKYPFFRPEDDRWKNSVRHNLSINPYFKKGEKSRGGAGHLWTISEESRGMRPNYRRKSSDNLCELELSMPMESDTDRAVASILGQYNLARATQLQQEQQSCAPDSPSKEMPKEDPLSTISDELPPPNPNIIPEAENPIILPDDIVIGYESLPPGTYTLELNGLSLQTENLFDLDTINQGGYVIVGEDDSNKENLSSISNIMNEVAALQNFPFMEETCVTGSVATSHLNFENVVEGPAGEAKRDNFNYPPRDMNNRNDFFPMPAGPQLCEEVLAEKQPLTPDSSHELLLLESMGSSTLVSLDDVMAATCNNEDHLPLPIMSEPLFDAKELGMIYPLLNEDDIAREGPPECEV